MLFMWVDSVHCNVETDEVGADEPYLIVLSVDLTNAVNVPAAAGGVTGSASVPIPASGAFLYGPLNDVDAGETHFPSFTSFWGLHGEEKALATPEDAIFIAALMENDSGSATAARGLVASQAAATILATTGATRATRLTELLKSVNSALHLPTGFPSTDEIVQIQELRFEQGELAQADTGQGVSKSLTFIGDGGRYTVSFQTRNRGQTAWRFCVKCHAMFFIGFSKPGDEKKGVCAAGGSHGEAGFTFFLPHDLPANSAAELGWRFCTKCFVMMRRGTGLGSSPGDPGVCAAGGGHDPQGFKFQLPHSHQGVGQDDWTRCGKCRTLFWDGEPNKGTCPAGGPHERARTLQGDPVGSFKLDFVP